MENVILLLTRTRWELIFVCSNKFNGETIIVYKERRDLGAQTETPFDIVIPPFTHVEFIFPNNGQAADLTAVLIGRVYGVKD